MEPIYLDKSTNEILYNTKNMENGKQYHIEWDGEHFLFIKENDGVAVYVREDDN